MVFTAKEILDIIVMSLVVGFIFMDFLIPHRIRSFRKIDFFTHFFNYELFIIAILVTAPALIFHELAHKFTAIAYGLPATFHALYFWLLIGILLRIFHSPIIFLIPGGVSIPAAKIAPGAMLVIAFSGPAVNLALFIGATLIIKFFKDKISQRTFAILYATKILNMFWFVLNMLPIPPTDGYKFFSSLIKILGI